MFYKDQPTRVRLTQKHMYEAHTGKKAGRDEDMGDGDLEEEVEEGDLPKDKLLKPFHFFQKALTAEWDSLTRKEQDSYEKQAILWRSLGPDEGERRWWVLRGGPI